MRTLILQQSGGEMAAWRTPGRESARSGRIAARADRPPMAARALPTAARTLASGCRRSFAATGAGRADFVAPRASKVRVSVRGRLEVSANRMNVVPDAGSAIWPASAPAAGSGAGFSAALRGWSQQAGRRIGP